MSLRQTKLKWDNPPFQPLTGPSQGLRSWRCWCPWEVTPSSRGITKKVTLCRSHQRFEAEDGNPEKTGQGRRPLAHLSAQECSDPSMGNGLASRLAVDGESIFSAEQHLLPGGVDRSEGSGDDSKSCENLEGSWKIVRYRREAWDLRSAALDRLAGVTDSDSASDGDEDDRKDPSQPTITSFFSRATVKAPQAGSGPQTDSSSSPVAHQANAEAAQENADNTATRSSTHIGAKRRRPMYAEGDAKRRRVLVETRRTTLGRKRNLPLHTTPPSHAQYTTTERPLRPETPTKRFRSSSSRGKRMPMLGTRLQEPQ